MDDRHFCERVRHHDRNQRPQQVTDDDARSRKVNCHATSKKEADSDRPSDRDHRKLSGVQPALQSFMFLRRRGGVRIWMRLNIRGRFVQGCHLRPSSARSRF